MRKNCGNRTRLSAAAALAVLLHSYSIIDVVQCQTDPGPLFLTPYISSGQIEVAKSLARVGPLPLSGVGPARESYSGFVTVNSEQDSNLFFWFFPALIRPQSAPLLVWLDGGPGVSNFLSVFNQNGPYLVNATGHLESRPRDADWTRNYSLIYVESPVGTGYSFTTHLEGYPTSSEETAVGLLIFLRQFRQLFPEYTSNPLHVVGESYGGHFAPALGSVLHREAPEMNMKGLLLIGPWTNPYLQAMYYADYLYQVGLIDEDVKAHFEQEQHRIQRLIRIGDFATAKQVWTDLISGPNSTFRNATGFDATFNVLQAQVDLSGYGFAAYVQNSDFRRAIHVGNTTYNLVSSAVQAAMSDEFMDSKSPHVEQMLDWGYQVIIVSGQLDLTVMHKGLEAMAEALEWNGKQKFAEAKRSVWKTANGIPAGYVRKARSLVYVLLRNGGHMLLMDEPRWGLELINKFIPVQERAGSQDT